MALCWGLRGESDNQQDVLGDPRIATDNLDSLDEDDLVVLVHSVLVDPVRVQDPQVGTSTTDTLLGGGLETSLELEVVDTLPDGLTVGGTCVSSHRTSVHPSLHRFSTARLTLGSGPLPVSPPDPDSVDDESLLGLVSQPPGLVGPRRPGSPVDDRELTVLPTTTGRGRGARRESAFQYPQTWVCGRDVTHRTRCKNNMTSLCFLWYNSAMYL